MAISLSLYSNANASSKTLSIDFVGNLLSSDFSPSNSATSTIHYYFKFSTTAKDMGGVNALPVKLVEDLTDLVLNDEKQRIMDTNVAYSNISAMIEDYTYDYINGHAANLYGSECTAQLSMKF